MSRITSLQESLIDAVERSTGINGSISACSCITTAGGDRRGAMSFVFSGTDGNGNIVALKFFDPEFTQDRYRLELFDREHKLLTRLIGKTRCLQLIHSLSDFTWEVRGSEGVTLRAGYFVTEWLEDDVDDEFLNQQHFSASRKLALFRKILLATETLHRETIAHRDIKMDNIRIRATDPERPVVLIDYGFAAASDLPPLNIHYQDPCGAPGYSPPEAFAGYEGDRHLLLHSDSYALGCLLYELFNRGYYYTVLNGSADFVGHILRLRAFLHDVPDVGERDRRWREYCRQFSRSLRSPSIDQLGHTVPPAIVPMLNRCLEGLTAFDYRRRIIDLTVIRRLIDSCLRVLRNEEYQRKVIERKRAARARRRDAAIEKRAKLALRSAGNA